MTRLFAVLLMVVLMGCLNQQDKNADTVRQLDQLYQQFSEAYDSLDVAKVSNLYAEDAYYLIPNPKASIMKSRSSIRNSFASFIEGAAENNRNIEITFRIVDRTIADSLAFDVGYYRARSKADIATEFDEGGGVGKFVTVMGLMPDGKWKFLLDGYNSAPYEAFAEADTAYNPISQATKD